jgi:hypothetical protein
MIKKTRPLWGVRFFLRGLVVLRGLRFLQGHGVPWPELSVVSKSETERHFVASLQEKFVHVFLYAEPRRDWVAVKAPPGTIHLEVVYFQRPVGFIEYRYVFGFHEIPVIGGTFNKDAPFDFHNIYYFAHRFYLSFIRN